uniref:Uncharacterized protein n=1 Tax=Octopus bimaculoides TaxID=37653 RepID=A0A0L8H880_OCTBM
MRCRGEETTTPHRQDVEKRQNVHMPCRENVAVSKYDEETLQCHEVKDEMKMSQGQDVNNMMARYEAIRMSRHKTVQIF